MTITKNHVTTGLLVLICVIGLILILTLLFKKKDSTDIDAQKALIAAKDETIKAIQHERDTYKEWNNEKDNFIAEHQRIDSILVLRSQQTIVKYERIPIAVKSLSNEDLRRAIYNY